MERHEDMVAKRTFTRAFMLEVLDGGEGEVVENVVIDTSRWNTIHRLTFLFEEEHWQATYERGSTECQGTTPWEYVDDVECTRVVQEERTVKVWVAS